MTTQKTIDRAYALLPHLIYAAQRGEIASYKAFGAKIGIHQRAVKYPLIYIRDEICAARSLPPLTAIVINRTTKMPGDGFLPDETTNLSRAAKLALYEALQHEVCQYAGWDALLAQLGITPPREIPVAQPIPHV